MWTPEEDAITRCMFATGFARMQAINHLRSQHFLKNMQGTQRNPLQ